MEFNYLILFFFSALGAFNGFFLSIYFAFFVKHRDRTTYFLAGLLLMLSVRVGKSVFLIFYPGISSTFVQVGLTACTLIGPFLYLYVKNVVVPERYWRREWLLHVVPVLVGMILIGYFYPYREYRHLWQRGQGGVLGWALFSFWLFYLLLALRWVKPSLLKLFRWKEKLTDKELWLVSVVIGNAIIWLAYNTSQYTSYIFGAFSFSFVFYLMILVWIFRKRQTTPFFDKPAKYANKQIADEEAHLLGERLRDLFEGQEMYRNSNLKLSEVAETLGVPAHLLSQYLNAHLGKSFNHFVNEYRIQAVEEMLKTSDHLTLEAIGAECGFRSNSSFYAAFKKVKGMTPARYRKAL